MRKIDLGLASLIGVHILQATGLAWMAQNIHYQGIRERAVLISDKNKDRAIDKDELRSVYDNLNLPYDEQVTNPFMPLSEFSRTELKQYISQNK